MKTIQLSAQLLYMLWTNKEICQLIESALEAMQSTRLHEVTIVKPTERCQNNNGIEYVVEAPVQFKTPDVKMQSESQPY